MRALLKGITEILNTYSAELQAIYNLIYSVYMVGMQAGGPTTTAFFLHCILPSTPGLGL